MSSNRNWQQKLADSLATIPAPAKTYHGQQTGAIAQLVQQLREAGTRFDNRRDNFAAGKGQICADIAAKVEKFGSFASDKQQEFAMKLISWSLPRSGAVSTPAGNGFTVPKLFAVMQKHAHFHAEPLKLSRKNQDSLCWIVFGGTCVGKIEDARVTLFTGRLNSAADTLGVPVSRVREMLAEFETDPLAAAKKYGKLSGRCCSCGRDLTDPESIEAGIGPRCAERFDG